MEIDELLAEIIRRVTRVTQPDRIILFGSAVTGTMTRDSDVDVLVLHADVEDTRAETVRLRRELAGLRMPIDVLVMRTDRFEETKHVIGGIAYPANKYGKVIYEAA